MGKPTVTGRIVGLQKIGDHSVFTISATIVDHDYDSEPLAPSLVNIAGQDYAVDSNVQNKLILANDDVSLYFTLKDDDVISLLPHPPNISTETIGLYAPAYILPVIDGGGNDNNNKNTVPFRRNTASVDPALWLPNAMETDGLRADNYWIANALTAFQSDLTPSAQNKYRCDGDSDAEGLTGAFVDGIGRGALFLIEEISEMDRHGANAATSEQRIWAHELGHTMGLPDRYRGEPGYLGDGMGGLMENTLVEGIQFIPKDLKILRNRIKSPGR